MSVVDRLYRFRRLVVMIGICLCGNVGNKDKDKGSTDFFRGCGLGGVDGLNGFRGLIREIRSIHHRLAHLRQLEKSVLQKIPYFFPVSLKPINPSFTNRQSQTPLFL